MTDPAPGRSPRQAFADLMARPDEEIRLDEASLLIAAEEYPDLDIARYLARLDTMAEELRARSGDLEEALPRIEALNTYLFEEQGLEGNREEYEDPRNSYLNEVLDRKLGIPITISIVAIEVARRLDWPVVGVGFPGHFIVKYLTEPRAILFDPYNNGAILTGEECRLRFEHSYGAGAPFEATMLHAWPNRRIMFRMLANLKLSYLQRQEFGKALAAVERMVLLDPSDLLQRRDRGFLNYQLGNYRKALEDLEAYLDAPLSSEEAMALRVLVTQLRDRLKKGEG